MPKLVKMSESTNNDTLDLESYLNLDILAEKSFLTKEDDDKPVL